MKIKVKISVKEDEPTKDSDVVVNGNSLADLIREARDKVGGSWADLVKTFGALS